MTMTVSAGGAPLGMHDVLGVLDCMPQQPLAELDPREREATLVALVTDFCQQSGLAHTPETVKAAASQWLTRSANAQAGAPGQTGSKAQRFWTGLKRGLAAFWTRAWTREARQFTLLLTATAVLVGAGPALIQAFLNFTNDHLLIFLGVSLQLLWGMHRWFARPTFSKKQRITAFVAAGSFVIAGLTTWFIGNVNTTSDIQYQLQAASDAMQTGMHYSSPDLTPAAILVSANKIMAQNATGWRGLDRVGEYHATRQTVSDSFNFNPSECRSLATMETGLFRTITVNGQPVTDLHHVSCPYRWGNRVTFTLALDDVFRANGLKLH